MEMVSHNRAGGAGTSWQAEDTQAYWRRRLEETDQELIELGQPLNQAEEVLIGCARLTVNTARCAARLDYHDIASAQHYVFAVRTYRRLGGWKA